MLTYFKYYVKIYKKGEIMEVLLGLILITFTVIFLIHTVFALVMIGVSFFIKNKIIFHTPKDVTKRTGIKLNE